jgi:hypothetical protein
MNGPIDPLRRPGPVRRALPAPRDGQRPEGEEEVVFIVEDDAPPPRQEPPRREGFAAFAAHVMGQSGQKRGLRGGQEVLDTARSTYLGTEYSGPADRRPQTGLLKKTKI